MGMSRLNIWIRDTTHPCLPYQSTGHTFYAFIFTCDLQRLNFGQVKNGFFPLTDVGGGGGKVHGQVEVPSGCYLVIAYATCKNVYTEMAMVQVGCNEEVCVNLLPRSVATCTGQLITTLNLAQAIGTSSYSFACPAGREIPEKIISNAVSALQQLAEHLPKDMLSSIVTLDELKEKAKKEMKR